MQVRRDVPPSRRLLAASVAVAALLPACGLRVSDTRVAAARRDQSVSAIRGSARSDQPGVTGTDGNPAADQTDLGAANPQGGGPIADSSPGAGPGATVAPGPRQPGITTVEPSLSPAVPPGGNGGATDVGVTATQITVGNVSTLSGPVPGLFAGAVVGTQAVIAYQNSLGGIYGRKLKVEVRDDQFDTGQNKASTIELIGKAFGMIGSFSLYDDAAVDKLREAKVPDVVASLSSSRRLLENNYSVAPVTPGGAALGPFNYYKARFPAEVRLVGSIYGDVPASKASYLSFKAASESVGWKYLYERGYGPTETDFTADVISMKQRGVKLVYLSSVDVKVTARLAKAMQAQAFRPFIIAGATSYDVATATLAGDALDGAEIPLTLSLYIGEDAPTVPEVGLFNQWLQKVKPGYKPDLFAAYGWGEGRLFIKAALAAGPRLTRAAMIAELEKIDDYDVNGFLPPAGPASKRPATCFVVVKISNKGHFARTDSPVTGFRCGDGGFHAAGTS